MTYKLIYNYKSLYDITCLNGFALYVEIAKRSQFYFKIQIDIFIRIVFELIDPKNKTNKT